VQLRALLLSLCYAEHLEVEMGQERTLTAKLALHMQEMKQSQAMINESRTRK
jgi:hypothetical protein